MPRVRVKICGITRAEDARIAVNCGVDAIGMILHADSPRVISESTALAIRKVVPAFVSLVGVFVNASQSHVSKLYNGIGLDLIQLHGEETTEYADELNLPFIRAIRAKSCEQVLSEVNAYPNARAVLIDPYVKGQHGGTGKSLSPKLWPNTQQQSNEAQQNTHMILAGGLGPVNVIESMQAVKPYAVDLNSGLEHAPGVKSKQKIQQTMLSINQWNLRGLG